jgi:AI-2 transport protein TqsA
MFGLVILAALVIVAVGLKSVSNIVAPIFLIITLVITVAPLRRWLVTRRLPSWLASVIALLVIYALLIMILGSVVWSLTRLATTLPQYTDEFRKLFDSAINTAAGLGFDRERLQQLAGSFDLSSFSGVASSLLSGITNAGSLLALMLAMVVFLAFDSADMGSRLDVIRQSRPQVADAMEEFAGRVRKYWVVTTIFGLVVAIINVAALGIIGVPLALTWGVLSFVTNYIPNIGFVLGLIPPALIALLEGGLSDMVAVIIVYTVVNLVVQTIIQPRFTGDAVGITGTVAFVSLIFWAFLLGALGALLAVPATLFVKALLVDHSDTGRWFGALIDSKPKPQPVRRRRAGTSSGAHPVARS